MTRDRVRSHYEGADGGEQLVARVEAALESIEGPITSVRIASLDQFHVRGLAATAELGTLLRLGPGNRVLDAGSGLGGPSRFLAETHDCHVTGVDLSPAYVRIADLLAARTGAIDRVRYAVADLARLPFADRCFDAAYTQHVVMNVRDRDHVYGEIRRVLEPHGGFAFHDVLLADHGAAPVYPLPWAEGPEDSVLLTEDETRASLASAGLPVDHWIDVGADALAWFARPRPTALGAPTLATVMGPRFGAMTANLACNLAEGRLRLVMARCTAR